MIQLNERGFENNTTQNVLTRLKHLAEIIFVFAVFYVLLHMLLVRKVVEPQQNPPACTIYHVLCGDARLQLAMKGNTQQQKACI